MSGVRVPAPPPSPSFRTRLRRVEPILRRALNGACALPRGARLLVGASGGADSTALLIALHSLAPEFGFELYAAHLHHGLRGREADGDLDAVTVLCEKLGVPLTHATWDTRQRMRNRGLSGQAGLRTLRREFLEGAAKRAHAASIATAHTADDQLETLLMRLLRGSALAGLSGMRPRRGLWIKPLLEATRHEIESDLRRHDVAWREDRTNADAHYLRSRIRHGVIPALVSAGRGGNAGPEPAAALLRARLARHAARATQEIREAHDALRSSAARRLDAGASPVRERTSARAPLAAVEVSLASLRGVSPALRRALLGECWRRACRRGPGLTHAHVDALLRLIGHGRHGAGLELPAGRHAAIANGRLSFATRTADDRTASAGHSRPNGLRVARDGKLPVPQIAKPSH